MSTVVVINTEPCIRMISCRALDDGHLRLSPGANIVPAESWAVVAVNKHVQKLLDIKVLAVEAPPQTEKEVARTVLAMFDVKAIEKVQAEDSRPLVQKATAQQLSEIHAKATDNKATKK